MPPTRRTTWASSLSGAELQASKRSRAGVPRVRRDEGERTRVPGKPGIALRLTVRCSAPKTSSSSATRRPRTIIARNRLQGTRRRLADLAAHDTTPQEVLRLLLRPAARVHHRLLPLPPPLWHEHRLRLLRTPSRPGPRPLLLRGASRLAPTVLPPVSPLARHLLRIAPSGSLHAKKRL